MRKDFFGMVRMGKQQNSAGGLMLQTIDIKRALIIEAKKEERVS